MGSQDTQTTEPECGRNSVDLSGAHIPCPQVIGRSLQDLSSSDRLLMSQNQAQHLVKVRPKSGAG